MRSKLIFNSRAKWTRIWGENESHGGKGKNQMYFVKVILHSGWVLLLFLLYLFCKCPRTRTVLYRQGLFPLSMALSPSSSQLSGLGSLDACHLLICAVAPRAYPMHCQCEFFLNTPFCPMLGVPQLLLLWDSQPRTGWTGKLPSGF